MEAAVVMPLLLMLTLGIWTTARAWNVHNTLDHAAREAARFGATEVPWVDGPNTAGCATPPTTSEEAIRCVADQELVASSILSSDVATICIDLDESPDGLGEYETCALGKTNSPQTGVVLEWTDYELSFIFFSIEVDLRASAVARWEG